MYLKRQNTIHYTILYIAVIHNSGSTYTFNARWTIGVYKITARCSETIYDNQREEYKTVYGHGCNLIHNIVLNWVLIKIRKKTTLSAGQSPTLARPAAPRTLTVR